MSSHIPITLRGTNLGARHRYLNNLVNEAYKLREPFDAVIALPEKSSIDRLFKIDLASKYKHVAYIRENLQDDDMLYVSRALKAKWLLDEEYRYIFTPVNLENILYPQMITTAVNKMKHWILLNLRDSVRCQEFYEYYFDKDVDYAFKFLCKCPLDIILKEFPKPAMLTKMTPQRFKILCERSPIVAKKFFEIWETDAKLYKTFLLEDYKYFEALKCILKVDVDIFLNINERNDLRHYKQVSATGTKFIMSHRKDRFMQKPEWYIYKILDIKKLAQCLTRLECEELVVKLARAEYLRSCDSFWYDHKYIDPFVNRLDFEKRAIFQKKMFIDKNYGELVKCWPYTVPQFDTRGCLYRCDLLDVFSDAEESPADYDFNMQQKSVTRTSNCKPKAKNKPLNPFKAYRNTFLLKPKTFLKALLDNYRFTSFDNILFELEKEITSESSSQKRLDMMLVLVIKCGGNAENLSVLLKFLRKHSDEPAQVRATVVGCLAMKGQVWRVTEDIWEDLLIISRGLGLDGSTPEANCKGLHTVVILRALLSSRHYDHAIKSTVINSFNMIRYLLSRLEPSLTTAEKQHVIEGLLKIFLESANTEVNTNGTALVIGYALDTLLMFKVKFETRLDVIASIKNFVRKDQLAASGILKRLFDSKLGRKVLFRENFDLMQTDASYVNALKHDITILSVDKFLQAVIKNQWNLNQRNLEQFIRKVSIYFNENTGLTGQFLSALITAGIHKNFARPIAYFIGEKLRPYILYLDSQNSEYKRFSAIIRANAHLARPAFKLDSLEMHKCGAKLIANKVFKCKTIDIDQQIQKLVTWKRTLRLAFILAERSNNEAGVFPFVKKSRPIVALKIAVKYFGRKGDQSDLRIWEIVKPLLVDLKKPITTNHLLMQHVSKVHLIPLNIRPEYATLVFKVINETHFEQSMSVLCHIKHLLPNIEEHFIEYVLYDYVMNRFVPHVIFGHHANITSLYMSLLGKYIFFCKTEETQNRRFVNIGQLYLDRLQSYWESTKDMTMFLVHLNNIFQSLIRSNETFLKEEYVSCQPVMDKFIQWMQGFLPMNRYFSSYVPLHVSMLYHRANQQASKLLRGVSANQEYKVSEGYKIFGAIFGMYISQEARVLTRSYFDSIIVIYSLSLVEWINSNLKREYLILPFIIKGIQEASEGIESTIALTILRYKTRILCFSNITEIRERFERMNLTEMQFCGNLRLIP